MKKTTNRMIIALILILTTAISMGLCVACVDKKPEEVTFENWKDTEITVDIGDSYVIPTTEVKGSDGNVYTCEIDVRDSKNEKVSVIAGTFDIEDVNGYVITLSVKVGSKTVSRKITVKVNDATAPEIFIGSVKVARPNEFYKLPQITVTDDSGADPQVTIKVLFGETEMKVENGGFTPAAEGFYTLKVSATDKAGNTASKEATIEVRNALSGGVFENFDNGFGLNSSINGKNAEVLEEFEGKNGVLHVPGTAADKTEYRFRLPGLPEEYKYQKIDSITLSLYVLRLDENGNVAEYEDGRKKGADVYDCSVDENDSSPFWKGLDGGKWLTYTVENFEGIDNFIEQATLSSGVRLFWTWTKYVELYVDEITYHAVPENEIALSASEAYAGEEVTATFENDELTYTLEVTAPDGSAVEVTDGKFVASVRGEYVVKVSVIAPEYLACEKTAIVTCSDKYVRAELPTYAETGDEITVPAGEYYDPLEEKTIDADVTVTVGRGETEIALEGGKFVPDEVGLYVVKYVATAKNDPTDTRTTEFTIVVGNSALDDKQLENFDCPESTGSFVGGAASGEWLPEYGGKFGVLKITQKSADEFKFKTRLDKASIEKLNIEFVEITLCADKSGWAGCYHTEDLMFNVTTNWKTLRIDATKYNGLMDKLFGSGEHLFWVWDSNVLYIDEIRFVTRPTVTAEAPESVNEGESVTVTATEKDDLPVTITVTDPEGKEVAFADGKFVADKAGTYTIKVVSEDAASGTKTEKTLTVMCVGYRVEAAIEEYVEIGSLLTLDGGKLVGSDGKEIAANIVLTVRYGNETIELKSNAFTPAKTGYYDVKYEATSTDGTIVRTRSARIFAGTSVLGENVIESFDYPASRSQCTNEVAEWLPEYNGRYGVLKITQNDTFGYYFKTRLTEAQLACIDWDVVEISLCSSEKRWICYLGTELNIQSTSDWMTISLPKADFTDLIAKWGEGAAYQLFWAWDTGDMYIDEIRFASYSEEETIVPEEKADANNGVAFDKSGNTYETATALDRMPVTVEAWVYVPSTVNASSVMFGNYSGRNRNPYMVAGITANGAPYIRVCDGNDRSYESVFDTVDVRGDKFVHLAFVLDGEQKRAILYVNGGVKQIVTGVGTFDVAPDDVFVVGGDLRGGNHSCFLGKIAGISFFDEIRTQSQIRADIIEVKKSDSLIASYDLDGAAEKTRITDLAGNIDMLVKETWLDDIDHVAEYDYSFAVIGDTQSLIYKNPQHMKDIYEWIAANRTNKKIKYAFGLGDITEFLYQSQNTDTDNREKQWGVAKAAISKLDGIVPYTLVRGNHDDSRLFNSTFNNSAYKQNLGGTRNGKIEDSYSIFYVGNTKYMVVTLDYNPSSESLEWAGGIIAANPDCRVIITTHSYLDYNGKLTTDGGEKVWNELASKYKNVVLVLSGHVQHDFIVTRKDKGVNGNTVTSVMINPQDVDLNGATGLVAMFYFDKNGKDISIEYYSTVKNKYFKARNQIKIDIDDSMVETPSAFDLLPSVYVGEVALGETGRRYMLPRVTAYSFEGIAINPSIKLYFGEEEIGLDGENAFVPTERGEYRMVITVDDGAGNVRTLEKTIRVRNPIAAGMIEDYDDEYSIDNAGNCDVEWLESFEGKTGVLHIKANDSDRSYYALRLFNDLTKFPVQPFDSIILRVYIATEAGSGSFYDTTTEKYTGISKNKWCEFTVRQFMDWQFFVQNASTDGGAILFNVWTKGIDIYIDEISFSASMTASVTTEKTEYAKGETITVTTESSYAGAKIETITVTAPDGTSFTVDGNSFVAELEGKYTIVYKVVCAADESYEATASVTVTVADNYFEYGSHEKIVAAGDEIIVPSATLIDFKTGQSIDGAEITYKVFFGGKEITVTDGKFTAAARGYYDIVYTAVLDGSIVRVETLSVGAKGKTVDFMDSELSGAVLKTAGNAFEEEFEGVRGVLNAKFDNTSYTHIYVNFGLTAEQLAAIDRDLVELRVFVKGTSSSGKFQTYYAGSWREWYQLNTWVTVKLAKSVLTDEYFTADVLGGSAELVQFQNATVTNVYFEFVDVRKTYVSTDGTERTIGFDNETDAAYGKSTTSEWLAEFEGAKGVLKATYTDTWAGLRINYNAAVADIDSKTYDAIVLRVFFEASATPNKDGQVQLLLPYTSSSWGSWYNVGEWVEIELDKEKIGTNLANMLKGEFRTFGTTNATITAVYVDYIEFVDSNGFDTPNSVANVKSGSNVAEWLAEFEGKKGVAKVTYGDTYDGLFLACKNTYGLTADTFTAIEFCIYIEKDGTSVGTGSLYNSNNKIADGLKAGWNVVTMTKEDLTADGTWYKTDFFGTFTTAGAMIFWCWDRAGYNMYIDYVKII